MEIKISLTTGQLTAFLEISGSTVYRLMAKNMPNIMVGSVHRAVLTFYRLMAQRNFVKQRGSYLAA